MLTPMLKEGGLLSSITAYVPNAELAATALGHPLSQAGIFAFAGFLGLTVLGACLFLYFSEKLYFKGVRGAFRRQSFFGHFPSQTHNQTEEHDFHVVLEGIQNHRPYTCVLYTDYRSSVFRACVLGHTSVS
ncbi:hypothetical protein U0355_11375 [Salimicrobium sp. PL1-032A]|uniref:hypothetical protein n=1 Tax=Salimicrobium sp. PL1-032A TaxID=3095364 RepID=UPI003260FFE2